MNTNDFLRKIPLFADLPQEDLDRLCEMVTEVRLPAGAELFAEGSLGDKAYVIKEGQLEILKSSGGRSVILAIRQPGEVIGEMSLLESSTRFASVRARTDSLLLAIRHDQLNHLLDTSPSAARAMLHTFTARLRSTDIILRQSEKMAQLGTLTAGIAHELNNPASAAQRGAIQLRECLSRLQQAQLSLNRLGLTGQQWELLASLEQAAKGQAVHPGDLDILERSALEEDVERWLSQQGIPSGWELASGLVNLGYGKDRLAGLAESFQPHELPVVLDWLEATYQSYGLLEEIGQGAMRIGEIIKALKSYVYLDQAPIQTVDLHEGIDNTLVMLRSKLKGGITVRREYAPNLPRIQAYGSELNQVWTNLIDNAIDAMEGRGMLVLRTRQEGEWIFVEIQDNGPGIPAEILPKLFNPFFTTKPVGKGTGLGLNTSFNIVQKHGGDIRVVSKPGQTCFEVRLPLDFQKVQSGAENVPAIAQVDDDTLRQILQETKTIAVVGMSDREDQPAYSVPAYLQRHGYRVLPVNPNLETVLGEKAYPDLLSLTDPVDLVLVFRRSEFVPGIVDQAIQIGAKGVWMQEGVIHLDAAETALEAGLFAVMDTCIRVTHKRLIGN